MRSVKIFVTLFAISQLCLLHGCGKAIENTADDKTIASINNYKMTVGDFRASAKAIPGAKKDVLEQLITRNILIQEAQKENFDKDRAFMKEIESYWEQALLKLLIKKKTSEFSAAFKGDKDKVEAAMEGWIKGIRASADVKIYEKNLDAVDISQEAENGYGKK
jgi:vacuolar-type H+-ATPase subunit I/STV1